MNNLQIIALTCDNYIETRVKDICNTFGKHLSTIFLSDTNINNQIIGYNTPKNYDGIQEKYIQFFLNYDFNKFDYYFFIDDDTYVNYKNINNLELNRINPENELCILRCCYLSKKGMDMLDRYTGYPMHKIHGKNTDLPVFHPSGGSGFILTKSACIKIKEYLKNSNYNDISRSGHGDVTIGFWMKNCNIPLLFSNKLWWSIPSEMYKDNLSGFTSRLEKQAVTYHYVNSTNIYKFYNEL